MMGKKLDNSVSGNSILNSYYNKLNDSEISFSQRVASVDQIVKYIVSSKVKSSSLDFGPTLEENIDRLAKNKIINQYENFILHKLMNFSSSNRQFGENGLFENAKALDYQDIARQAKWLINHFANRAEENRFIVDDNANKISTSITKDGNKEIFFDFDLDAAEVPSEQFSCTENKIPEWMGFYEGIQFPKHFLARVPLQIRKRFCLNFHRILYRYYLVLKSGGSGKNNIKLMKGTSGEYLISKCRLDGNFRLLWQLSSNHIFNILAIVSHDVQSYYSDRNHQSKNEIVPGKIFWKTYPFLQQLRLYQIFHRTMYSAHEMEVYLDPENCFNYDNIQKESMETANEVRNVSVIGNAGSGKSVVGGRWLEVRQERNEKSIYLTMSRNLVEQKEHEFRKQEKIREEGNKLGLLAKSPVRHSEIEFISVHDYLYQHALKEMPDSFSQALNEVDLLGAQESFRFFHQACNTVPHGWNKLKDADSYPAKVILAWQIVHGVIKGCISGKLSLDYQSKPVDEGHGLSIEECRKRIRKAGKIHISEEGLSFIYKHILPVYQQLLNQEKKLDDNDVARHVLHHCQPDNRYDAVFLDECQDLTEVEITALCYLLKNATHKMMASDRCQMIQPTLFDPRQMITDANRINGIIEAPVSPSYLHYNYRSSYQIIAFQNFITQWMSKQGTSLTVEEKEPVSAIESNKGMFPIWIKSNPSNIQQMESLLKELDDVQIKILLGSKALEGCSSDAVLGNRDLEDVYDCKGLEYPSVLLWNILSTAGRAGSGNDWPWRLFYVGATRAQQRLLIFEEADSGKIGEFLDTASSQGVIRKCENLLDIKPDSDMIWLEWLQGWLSDTTAEERLQVAENYRQSGRFLQAAKIYKHFVNEGYREEYLFCMANYYLSAEVLNQNDEAMDEALLCYIKLGDLAHKEIRSLLKREDVPSVTYLAGKIWLSDTSDMKEFQKIRKDYQAKYQTNKTVDEQLPRIYRKYPFLREKIIKWKRFCIWQLYNHVKSINKTMKVGV